MNKDTMNKDTETEKGFIPEFTFRLLPDSRMSGCELWIEVDDEVYTIAALTFRDPEKPPVYEIYDWEAFRLFDATMQILEVEEAMALPPIDNYVYRLAAGEIPEGQEEILGQIEIQRQDGEVRTLTVEARGNIINIKHADKTTLQIELATRLAVCEECREIYSPVRKDQRFCSTKCRNRFHQREWRQLHRE